MYSSCLRCKRALKNPESMKIGYGPVCLKKVSVKEMKEDMENEDDLFLDEKQYEDLLKLEPITLRGHWQSRDVWLNGSRLSPGYSQAVRNHSPDGFNWGYGGSGPAQLALAVMLAVLKNRNAASSLYQQFKWDHIATLPQSDFEVTIDIAEWLKKQPEKLCRAS